MCPFPLYFSWFFFFLIVSLILYILKLQEHSWFLHTQQCCLLAFLKCMTHLVCFQFPLWREEYLPCQHKLVMNGDQPVDSALGTVANWAGLALPKGTEPLGPRLWWWGASLVCQIFRETWNLWIFNTFQFKTQNLQAKPKFPLGPRVAKSSSLWLLVTH